MKIYKIKKNDKKKLILIGLSVIASSIVVATSVGIASSLKQKVIQPSQLDERIKNIASKIKPNKNILFSFQQSNESTTTQDKSVKNTMVSTALQFVSLNDFLNNVNKQITSNETKKYLENFLNFNEILFELNTKSRFRTEGNSDFQLVKNPSNQNQWITSKNNNLYFFIQDQNKSTNNKDNQSKIIAVPLNIVDLFGKTNFDNSFSFSDLKVTDFFKQSFKDSINLQNLNINSIRQLWWQQWQNNLTNNGTKNTKFDLSLISVFDFLHIFKSSFFASKKDKDNYLLSIISNSLKKPLIKQLNFINANLNDITKENLDKFFEINFKLDSDSLQIYLDNKENTPYLKVDGLVEIKTKFIDVSTVKKFEIKISNLNFLNSKQENGSTESDTIYHWLSSKYQYDSDKVQSFDSHSSNPIGINHLENLIENQEYNQVSEILEKPDFYGLQLNDEQKLQAISRDFKSISPEMLIDNSKIGQNKIEEQNQIINVESKLFKNNLDVPRFLFDLAHQGIYNVAVYFLEILKSAGFVSEDTIFFNNEPNKIFEKLSEIHFINPKEKNSNSKFKFKLFSFNHDYLDTSHLFNEDDLSDKILYLSTLYIPFYLASIKNDFATEDSNQILYKIATFNNKSIQNLSEKSDFFSGVQPYYKNDKSKQVPIDNLADLLLAFYAKLRFLANSNFGFPLLKLGNHLGYQVVFKSDNNSNQASTSDKSVISKKLKISYQYRFGFLKNGKISFELFRTAYRSLNDINFYQDQVDELSDKKEQNILNLDKIVLETPEAFKKVYLTQNDFNNLNHLVTSLPTDEALQKIGLTKLIDYYKTIDPKLSLVSKELTNDTNSNNTITNLSKFNNQNIAILQFFLERDGKTSSTPLTIGVYNLGLS